MTSLLKFDAWALFDACAKKVPAPTRVESRPKPGGGHGEGVPWLVQLLDESKLMRGENMRITFAPWCRLVALRALVDPGEGRRE